MHIILSWLQYQKLRESHEALLSVAADSVADQGHEVSCEHQCNVSRRTRIGTEHGINEVLVFLTCPILTKGEKTKGHEALQQVGECRTSIGIQRHAFDKYRDDFQ